MNNILDDMELLLILLGAVMVLELYRRLFLFSTRRGRKGDREESKYGRDELLNQGVTSLFVQNFHQNVRSGEEKRKKKKKSRAETRE